MSDWHGKDSKFFLPRHLIPCVRQLLPPAHPPTYLPGTLPCTQTNSTHHFHTSKCREASLLATAEQGIYVWTLLNYRKTEKPHRNTNKEAARNPPLMLICCCSPTRKARDVRQPKSPISGLRSHLLKPWFSTQKMEMVLRSRGCKEN